MSASAHRRHLIGEGEDAIPVTFRRSARARRFTLKVDRISGEATLTLPARAREAEALAFAREKQNWLRQHAERAMRPVPYMPGVILPFRGRPLVIEHGAPNSRVKLRDGAIYMPMGRPEALESWLKAEARTHLSARAHSHAQRLGRTIRRITIGDPKSRWGSCSSRDTLSFSWRLIMTPDPVSDYVAAHEAAHLIEMNHSAAFWKIVAELCPQYQDYKDWLKRNGPALHVYRPG